MKYSPGLSLFGAAVVLFGAAASLELRLSAAHPPTLRLSAAAAQSAIAPRPGWRVIETNFAFDALTERLDAAIKAEGMLRVYAASASRAAKGRGIDIPGNRVVGVFRNDYAVRMLSASVAAGMEAPIEFYLTENPDGGATLSYEAPSAAFAPYFEEGGAALETLAAELDAVFAAIAARAVAE